MADLGIDATASGADSNSYLTLEEADDMLDGFPSNGKWDDLEEEDQAQVLLEGTRRIDQFRTWGAKRSKTQRLSFPRGADKAGAVPEAVKKALAAFCNYVADKTLVALKTMQAEGVSSTSILGQDIQMEKDPSGLPSESRQELEKLFRTAGGWGAGGKGGSVRDGECQTLF